MAGLFGPVGMNPMQQGTFAPTMQTSPEQPMRKGGLFGSGIKWNDVAGIIGDALLSANGSQPVYTPLVMQQRSQQNALARMQAQRQQELQDQMALYDYKRANPMPLNNDTVNDFNWFKSLSESDRQLYAQLHPQFITTDNGDGTKTVVPVTPGMFNQQQAPQQPMHDLPPGYSITGGPGRNAGGGFR